MQTRYDIFVISECVLADGDRQVVMLDPSSRFAYKRVLIEWAKAKLESGSWRNALIDTSDVRARLFLCIVKLTV